MNGAIIKAIAGSGCRMNPRYVSVLLLTVLVCVALVNADDQKNQPAHISKQTRMDLIVPSTPNWSISGHHSPWAKQG